MGTPRHLQNHCQLDVFDPGVGRICIPAPLVAPWRGMRWRLEVGREPIGLIVTPPSSSAQIPVSDTEVLVMLGSRLCAGLVFLSRVYVAGFEGVLY